MTNCDKCNRPLANSVWTDRRNGKKYCAICVLGPKEGSQSKYWETSLVPKPEGFRYPDDTAKYKYNWDSKDKKWKDKDGNEQGADEL